jgi:hypothetical protein
MCTISGNRTERTHQNFTHQGLYSACPSFVLSSIERIINDADSPPKAEAEAGLGPWRARPVAKNAMLSQSRYTGSESQESRLYLLESSKHERRRKYIYHRFRNSTRSFPALDIIIETMWTINFNGQIIPLLTTYSIMYQHYMNSASAHYILS